MVAVIWKYPLKHKCENYIDIPAGGKILSLQMQGNVACIWVLVKNFQPGCATESRCFEFFGTGEKFELEDHYHHIGTIQEGAYVWHFFETTPPRPKTGMCQACGEPISNCWCVKRRY